MSDGVFKAPRAKKTVKIEDPQAFSPIPNKRCRTVEDFVTFCNFILEYENYEAVKQEELRTKTNSPLGSTGSGDSIKSESASSSTTSSSDDRKGGTDIESDEDSWDLVTCFCMKPFAGRPMIECSKCLTWLHLSCAKVRKSHIPDEFVCQRCKDAKSTARRSHRRDQEMGRSTGTTTATSLASTWVSTFVDDALKKGEQYSSVKPDTRALSKVELNGHDGDGV